LWEVVEGDAGMERGPLRHCCSGGKGGDFKDTREFSIYGITEFGISKSNPIHDELLK
jgi:hypothetical protein